MDVRRFKADLYELAARASKGKSPQTRSRVLEIADILVGLYKKNLVKINHSALELVCAAYLVERGYEVKVEYRLDSTLVCDVLGRDSEGPLIVEIETGFIPPEAALEPTEYARTRISSKIARYSRYAGKFALGTTPSYVLDIPEFFVRKKAQRKVEDAELIKRMTDAVYNKPPVTVEELMGARLNSIFSVNVDSATVQEHEPGAYADLASAFLEKDHGGGARNRQSGRSPRGRVGP